MLINNNKNQRPKVLDAIERIAAIRAEDPAATAEMISKRVGLTRQRVSQLLAEMKLPPRLSRASAIGTLNLASYSKNLAAELAVAAHLIEKGFAVYRPETNLAFQPDLIVMRQGGEIITIDVKSEMRPGESRLEDESAFDVVASVATLLIDGSLVHRVSFSKDIEAIVRLR